MLAEILTTMQDQTRLLEELPGALAATIRDELAREGTEGHGLEQRRIIDALGTGGDLPSRWGWVARGKTTLLRP